VYSEATYNKSKPADIYQPVEDDYVRICQWTDLNDCYDFYVDPNTYNDTFPLYVGKVDDMSKFKKFRYGQAFVKGGVRSY